MVPDAQLASNYGRPVTMPRSGKRPTSPGTAATRWGIFHAGLASAADPRYTVLPQRQRVEGLDADGEKGDLPPAGIRPAPGLMRST